MLNILLVDDSKMARMIVGKTIEKLGHNIVAQAADGEKGFEAYKEHKPDLVLSDIEMPVLDGHGMVKKIKEFDPEASIVMISSIVNAQFLKRIINEGAIDTITKPVSEEKLKEVFEKLENN